MSHQITMFTQPGCGQCGATKRLFSQLGIEPAVVDVTKVPEALALVRSWGYASVPIVAVTPVTETADSVTPVVTVSDIKGSVLDHWSGFRESKIRDAATFVLAHREATPQVTAMPVADLAAVLVDKHNITSVAGIDLIAAAVGRDIVVASGDGQSTVVVADNVVRVFDYGTKIYESSRVPLSHQLFIAGVRTTVKDLALALNMAAFTGEPDSDELIAARLERDHAVRDAARSGVSYTTLVELTAIAQPTLENIVAGFPGPDRANLRSDPEIGAVPAPVPTPSISSL